MVRDDDEMFSHTPPDAFFQESQTSPVLFVETLPSQTAFPESYSPKVRDSSFGKERVARFDMSPKRRCDQVDAGRQCDYAVVITTPVGAYGPPPIIVLLLQVEPLVNLMIAGDNDCPFKMIRSPIPKGVLGVPLISDIAHVTCEHKHITRDIERMALYVLIVLGKLQMEI